MTPTRWTRSSTVRGTSCASSRRTTTRWRSIRPRLPAGRRSTRTSAVSSTRSCTLLYARFITKVLFDMGLIDFTEPSRTSSPGMVLLDGQKMSKSKGNLVLFRRSSTPTAPTPCAWGWAFAGPVEDDKDWADVSTTGAQKFLARAMRHRRGGVEPGRCGVRRWRRRASACDAQAPFRGAGPGRADQVQRLGRPPDGAREHHPQDDRRRSGRRPTPLCARPLRRSP